MASLKTRKGYPVVGGRSQLGRAEQQQYDQNAEAPQKIAFVNEQVIAESIQEAPSLVDLRKEMHGRRRFSGPELFEFVVEIFVHTLTR